MKRQHVPVSYSIDRSSVLLRRVGTIMEVLLLLITLAACGSDPGSSTATVGRPPTATVQRGDEPTATSAPATPTADARGCVKLDIPANQVRVMKVTAHGYACEHQRPCGRTALAGQSTVYVDGEARTGDSSDMVLQSRSAVIELRNNATIHFKEISNSIEHVSVEVGRLFASHDRCENIKLLVSAGSMRIESLGTDFEVFVEGETADVAVVTGTLQISLYDAEGTELVDTVRLSSETDEARLPSIPLFPDVTYRFPKPIKLPEVDRNQYWERKQEWRNIDRINSNVFVEDTSVP